jgi:lipopolysaccharide/colanic/teichoic acid biosynthesis glycosyltransferase
MRRVARLLVVIGTVVVVLGLGKVHAVRHNYDYTGSFRFAWSFAYIAMLGVAAYGLGLPELVRDRRGAVASALGATGAAALGISVLQFIGTSALLPRFVVFGAVTLLVPWYATCSALARGGRVRAEGRDRVVVVAEPDEVARMRDDLALAPERHAQIVAALTAGDAATGDGAVARLIDIAEHTRASVVVLSRIAQADDAVVDQAAHLHESGIRIRTMSKFYEEWLGKLPLSELERVSLMFDVGELHRARYGRVKRLTDIVLGAIGCIVLVIVSPVVFFGNLVANGGPLFYRQERVGRADARFEILKFRTMRSGEGPAPSEWTSEDDPRITPFGRVMRRTHLDELPQFINIVRGDLSVVGPRPEQPRYVDELEVKIPFYRLRHLVRPGLTGWAQVKYGYAGNETDALEKLQYEFFYLRHQSFALDLRIIGRTVRSVVGLGGR